MKWVRSPRNSRLFERDYDKPGDTKTDRFDTTVEWRWKKNVTGAGAHDFSLAMKKR